MADEAHLPKQVPHVHWVFLSHQMLSEEGGQTLKGGGGGEGGEREREGEKERERLHHRL